MGGLGKSILNEGALGQKATYYTMDYLPVIGYKKASQTEATEYYEVDVKFVYGGSTSPLIVMNKVKKPATVKYHVDVTIKAKDADKEELWSKSGSINDFSESISGTIDKKHFKIEGEDKLTMEEIEVSMLLAIQKVLEE